MKKIVHYIGFIISAAVLVSCGNNSTKNTTNDLSGEISLSGAFALYPLAVEWANEFQKLHPNVKIDVSAGGAGKGITDALAKVVDLGMVSRELYPEEIEQGAIGFPVAKDAVVATVNCQNPAIKDILARGLTIDKAMKIWVSGDAKTWGEFLGNNSNIEMHVYTRSDACGAAETWANWFGKKQEDLGGIAIFGDPGLAQAVQKDIYGIGFNNIGYAYDNVTHKLNPGLAIIPIDINNDGKISDDEFFYNDKDSISKAIAEDKYPSPPARDLYLVSNGIPQNTVVLEFLKFVLSKEGQAMNEPAGYVRVSQEKIDKALQRLHK